MNLFPGSGFESISPEANTFFRQFAETLNLSQQTVASWEVGRRVPVATLPTLARALSVSTDGLAGQKAVLAQHNC